MIEDDSLSNLPHLVLLELGMLLDRSSVARLMQTCRRLNKVLSHRFVWRALYEREYAHAFTLCCVNTRLSNGSPDWQVFLKGVPETNRDGRLRVTDSFCQDILTRITLDNVQRQSTLDFCCNHWRAIYKRRVLLERQHIFERTLRILVRFCFLQVYS